MHEAIKAWHRLALMALLKRNPKQTAAELSEQLAAYCQADAVPPTYWRGMDPTTTFGVLRQMERTGLVEKAGSKPDGRAGRPAPLWALCDPDAVLGDFPSALPDTDEATRSQKTRQDEVLLNAFDELAGIMARHRRELDGFSDRLRMSLGLNG